MDCSIVQVDLKLEPALILPRTTIPRTLILFKRGGSMLRYLVPRSDRNEVTCRRIAAATPQTFPRIAA